MHCERGRRQRYNRQRRAAARHYCACRLSEQITHEENPFTNAAERDEIRLPDSSCKAKNINSPMPLPPSLLHLPDLIIQALHIKMSAKCATGTRRRTREAEVRASSTTTQTSTCEGWAKERRSRITRTHSPYYHTLTTSVSVHSFVLSTNE